MDRQGRDKVFTALESTGFNLDLVEILPVREAIPEEGIRFMTVVLLDQTVKHDLMRSLRYSNLLYDFGAPPEGPSLKALKTTLAHDLDLLFEDTSMRGTGVEEDKAKIIYRKQPLDMLDLKPRQYNLLTVMGLTNIELLAKADIDALLQDVEMIKENDVTLINEALAPYNLAIGSDNPPNLDL